MSILREICKDLPEGKIDRIGVGSHWVAMVMKNNGYQRCGLASNPFRDQDLEVPVQMELDAMHEDRVLSYDRMAEQHPSFFSSIWVAAINSLLPWHPEQWVDANAGEVIAEKGEGKRVALVGHFPFVSNLRDEVGELNVLELNPQEGDLEADKAPEVIPQADVVAITSMALINGTMENLLSLCPPSAYVIVLGPSTPLSPVMFDYGVDMLCGSIVENIDPVITSVLDGDHFRQIKSNGVRLVTVTK